MSDLPGLVLEDGTRTVFRTEVPALQWICDQVTRVMDLRPVPRPNRIVTVAEFPQGISGPASDWTIDRSRRTTEQQIRLPLDAGEPPEANMARLAAFLCLDAMTRGALLIHGALVELHGRGTILAGPSGVGKSTACRRLPQPWKVLSDDTCLAVPTPAGDYMAHPWPTWSALTSGDRHTTWDVQRGTPLSGIGFLVRGNADQLEELPVLEALGSLLRVTEQGSILTLYGIRPAERKEFRIQQFESASRMAPRMTCRKLTISLDGAFWDLLR